MRNALPALVLALTLGIAPMTRAAELITPSSAAITQTVVTLSPGIDMTLASANGRRYLCVMNIGAGPVTLGFDQAAVAGAGWALAAAAAAGYQGGSMCWESATVTANTVHAISAAGSTVAVLEGR